jgi:hypothetical protein
VSLQSDQDPKDAGDEPVRLQSAKYLKEAGDVPWQFDRGPGWYEIGTGLKLVTRGYCVLLAGSIVGLFCLWVALSGRAPLGPSVHQEDCELLLPVAVLIFGLTAVCSYGLVLAGQWRCLVCAPPRHSVKELMYISVYCLLIGAGLNVAGTYQDGGKTYAALRQGWAGLDELDPWSAGNLMQMVSVLLGVFGSLVFSQALHNVADCVQAHRRARAVDVNLWFMGLLIGGTLGVHLFVQRLSLKAEALPWLVGGWLLCFAWHLLLVLSVHRFVEAGLQRAAESDERAAPEGGLGTVLINTLSGLHRLARNARD